MKKAGVLVLAMCSLLLLPFAGRADTSTGVMTATARILATAVASASSLSFGDFTRGSDVVDGQATITLTVSPGVAYHVALSAGAHLSGAARHLEKDGFLVEYRLFQPSGAEWGDSSFDDTYPAGTALSGVGSGSAATYAVRGELYPGSLSPDAPAGTYSDMATVTVYY